LAYKSSSIFRKVKAIVQTVLLAALAHVHTRSVEPTVADCAVPAAVVDNENHLVVGVLDVNDSNEKINLPHK
jgi:hypothetical protein